MSTSTITPNMNLIVPTVGTEAGPQYALDINNSLTSVDQHDHSTGKGVQIGTSGLNIQNSFSLNSNFLIGTAGVTFTTQSSVPAAPNTLYVKLGTEATPLPDLFYDDGTSAPIQITSGGLVNATVGSLPGQSYAGGTFIWKQGTGSTTPANFDIGSLITRPDVSSTTFGVTIQPNSGIATDYNFILPASLPSSQSFVTLDNSGNLTAGVAYSQGITNSQIAPQTINQSLIASGFGLTPTGAILPFAGTTAPSGYLLCDGTSYANSAQTNLFGVIGYAYGGDGTAHFNVPDLRGQFLRGVTGSSSTDPDASSRTALKSGGNTGNNVGSAQTSAFQSHAHSISPFSTLGISTGSGATEVWQVSTGAVATTSAGGSSETRPTNVYVNYIIKN